jgi:hypothetical protein
MTRHVDSWAYETHALTTQARAMTREGRKAVRMHDPMERYVRLVAVP